MMQTNMMKQRYPEQLVLLVRQLVELRTAASPRMAQHQVSNGLHQLRRRISPQAPDDDRELMIIRVVGAPPRLAPRPRLLLQRLHLRLEFGMVQRHVVEALVNVREVEVALLVHLLSCKGRTTMSTRAPC